MKFSIIIPTLNEAQTIAECLKPLQALRKQAELIVVDGGSADATVKLAKPLADKLTVAKQGRAVQMNAGAKLAQGEYLIFLHADTLLPYNAFVLISDALANNHKWGRFDVELSGSHPLLKIVAWFMNWRSRLTGISTGDQAIFINKRLFESIGGFPVIALMEDIALSKKLKKISPPACLKAKVITSGRRWEHYGVVKTILLMWSLRLRYFLGADPQYLANLYKDNNG